MIIAVCNQKGGVGKTATAQAIAAGAAKIGRKTLSIDLDAQGNLTFSMGGNSNDVGVYDLLTGKAKAGQIIQKTKQGDIMAAGMELAEIGTAAAKIAGTKAETALSEALKPVKRKYDTIVIDCPPALNVLLLNALVASNLVIIPLTADIFALQGLYQLKQTIDWAQSRNKGLQIGGVLFIRHNTRTILARDLTDIIKDKCSELGLPVYDTTIREGVAIREAQAQGKNIFEYAPRSRAAQDYMKLIEEIGL